MCQTLTFRLAVLVPDKFYCKMNFVLGLGQNFTISEIALNILLPFCTTYLLGYGTNVFRVELSPPMIIQWKCWYRRHSDTYNREYSGVVPYVKRNERIHLISMCASSIICTPKNCVKINFSDLLVSVWFVHLFYSPRAKYKFLRCKSYKCKSWILPKQYPKGNSEHWMHVLGKQSKWGNLSILQ